MFEHTIEILNKEIKRLEHWIAVDNFHLAYPHLSFRKERKKQMEENKLIILEVKEVIKILEKKGKE